MRERQYYRDVNRRKALRKRRIVRKVYGWDYYNNLHQYSKNKIHCSCPICTSHTDNSKKSRKFSDQRRLQKASYELENFEK